MVLTLNRQDLKERITARLAELKGGSGSGNFGHAGRPGERGGSGEGEGKDNDSKQIRLEKIEFSSAAKKVSEKRFGPNYVQKIAQVSGALEGSDLKVEYDPEYKVLVVHIGNKNYEATRLLYKDFINNNHLEVFKTGEGLGTKILLQQTRSAPENGFKYISTTAGRDRKTNGYYTWPRLGYDSTIYASNFRGKVQIEAEKLLQGNRGNLSDLMKTPKGREFWRKNGYETSMIFDLSKGSLSKTILESYAKEKGIK